MRGIFEGMPVLSSDGIVVGKVVREEADGMVVLGNAIVHGEHFVSRSEISGVFAGEIFLRKRAADVAAAQPSAPGP